MGRIPRARVYRRSSLSAYLLALDGGDIRDKPLYQRKRLLAGIMPRVDSRIRLVEGVHARGVDFFRVACVHDLEGLVAKWKHGTYQSGPKTSWSKIRNPRYSEWEGRRELFDARSSNATRRRLPAWPQLALCERAVSITSLAIHDRRQAGSMAASVVSLSKV